VTGSDLDVVTTARLLVRPPREADGDRFVELFCDEDFMVFYPSVPWKQAPVAGYTQNLYTLPVGEPATRQSSCS
jgi:RimJ/RimL family protein N-acetyltransferase